MHTLSCVDSYHQFPQVLLYLFRGRDIEVFISLLCSWLPEPIINLIDRFHSGSCRSRTFRFSNWWGSGHFWSFVEIKCSELCYTIGIGNIAKLTKKDGESYMYTINWKKWKDRSEKTTDKLKFIPGLIFLGFSIYFFVLIFMAYTNDIFPNLNENQRIQIRRPGWSISWSPILVLAPTETLVHQCRSSKNKMEVPSSYWKRNCCWKGLQYCSEVLIIDFVEILSIGVKHPTQMAFLPDH